MKKALPILLLTIFSFNAFSDTRNYYLEALIQIDQMLSGQETLNYSKAIFLTENAYYENKLNETVFNRNIENYAAVCRSIIQSGNIIYPESDIEKATAQCAVFLFMMDSVPIQTDRGIIYHTPFQYNFDDFAGKEDWTNMFVSTLMDTKKGNCHSLPVLYKLIMNKLGQQAFLAYAPNHMYIKVNNKRVGWYNIELTNGDFPTDAWLMASGYIHSDAIKKGTYMKALTEKESTAALLVNLAHGYLAKYGYEDCAFISACCQIALNYFPGYINALLLQAETDSHLFHQLEDGEEKEKLLDDLNNMYAAIHEKGYRKMPENMYLNWLNSMGTMTTNHRVKSLLFNQQDLEQ